MTAKYIRSELFCYCELRAHEQVKQAKELDHLSPEELEDETFVKDPCNPEEFLPLSMFVKTGGKFTHAVYGLSAFSAYYLTMNMENDAATIAYKHF